MTDPFATPEEIDARNRGLAIAGNAVRQQIDRDYQAAFAGREGEAVLADLIARFGGVTYTRGDPHHTAFREGQRSVLEHIAASIGRAAGQDRAPQPGDNDAQVAE